MDFLPRSSLLPLLVRLGQHHAPNIYSELCSFKLLDLTAWVIQPIVTVCVHIQTCPESTQLESNNRRR